MVVSVTPSRDCSLTLTNVHPDGSATVIFPNRFQPSNLIRADRETQFGAAGGPFQLRLADPGRERLVADCSLDGRAPPGLAPNFGQDGLTAVSDYSRSLTRAIVVEAQSQAKPKAAAPNARASIVVDVR